ncbi:MAG TPA: hypothetical protein VK054_11015, partial [Beutenbergiaceae bacterium]|nr:hypothetical protein [Beutenbergiaceae bacterium]
TANKPGIFLIISGELLASRIRLTNAHRVHSKIRRRETQFREVHNLSYMTLFLFHVSSAHPRET